MKIEINLSNKSIISDCKIEWSENKELIIFGNFDKLHLQGKTIVYPSYSDVLSYLQKENPDSLSDKFPEIEGKFLILYQSAEKTIIFCDKYSIQRVYYSLQGDKLILSDKIFSNFNNLSLSKKNLQQFLLLRFVSGKETLFQGINRLMPGEILSIDYIKRVIVHNFISVYPKLTIDNSLIENKEFSMHYFFRRALEERISNRNNNKLIVPISGGLDSRYILATLLELVSPDKIITMTFGSKGTFDYEFGKMTAKAAGVKSISYPLTINDFSFDNLSQNCYDTDAQINFITESPLKAFREIESEGNIIISGYVGDTIMGAKAVQNQVNTNRSIFLADCVTKDENLFDQMVSKEVIDNSFFYKNERATSLSAFENWFFINHFTKYSNYCVFKNSSNLNYINPFIDYKLNDYVLNLPFEYRHNRSFYFKWFTDNFNDFALVPTKIFDGANFKSNHLIKKFYRLKSRILKHYFHLDYSLNSIDFKKHWKQLINLKSLNSLAEELLSKNIKEIIFENPCQYYQILLNLRCIEILKSNYNLTIH